MRYTMKSGILYNQDGQKLARIKSSFCGPQKEILGADGNHILSADIRQLESPPERAGDVRFREYTLAAENGEIITGEPGYADGEDPLENGWKICRMPRVDHVRLRYEGDTFVLIMKNSQNYILLDGTEKSAVQIIHRGIVGGWDIETEYEFTAGFLCGIFVFCRYIERENEFVMV